MSKLREKMQQYKLYSIQHKGCDLYITNIINIWAARALHTTWIADLTIIKRATIHRLLFIKPYNVDK